MLEWGLGGEERRHVGKIVVPSQVRTCTDSRKGIECATDGVRFVGYRIVSLGYKRCANLHVRKFADSSDLWIRGLVGAGMT